MSRMLINLIPCAKQLVTVTSSPVIRCLGKFQLNKNIRCLSDISYLVDRPKIAKPAPDFSGTAVINGEFKNIKLKDYHGKYIVLFFYPLNFTFVCPTELIAFSDKMAEFKKLNTEVIGVSTDSHFSHLAWTNTPKNEGGLGGDLGYPLLSDLSRKISVAYNVLIPDEGIALRGLFIIDKDGILRQITVNDLPVGRSVDEILRLVKAFQFVEQHGEVCPANWQPDSKTIIPNPKDSKTYFKSVNK
ncbi:PREDICTED: peroxiredoxin-2 [Ceratosolen solmsi marchali]|uniref:thioredoxin-dependent peroxiredoxin n=1 Tax=Ceratosolen solmsi marchali TaxID=326594 RepID=A0AAJ6YVF7_9HYME|nr:PREDICTED: peroxiredoxin-2 [Ceratosolen solmsi marchali]